MTRSRAWVLAAAPDSQYSVPVRRPWARLVAWLIDWLVILGWAAVVAAVGVPLYLAGAMAHSSLLVVNAVAFVALVGPVTLALAGLEASAGRGSLGKRARRLVVVSAAAGTQISFARSLARNGLKVAVPWTLGHAAVYAITATSAFGTVPLYVWILTGSAYVLPVVYVVSLFLGSGRTLYDRLAGTSVLQRS